MSLPRVKSDVKVPDALTAPQPRKQRAEVLQQLFRHVRDEAAALVEISEVPKKAKLRSELQINAHSLQKTLDTIQRGCL